MGNDAMYGLGANQKFDYNEIYESSYQSDPGCGCTAAAKWWGSLNADIVDNAFINDGIGGWPIYGSTMATQVLTYPAITSTRPTAAPSRTRQGSTLISLAIYSGMAAGALATAAAILTASAPSTSTVLAGSTCRSAVTTTG